MSIMAITFTNVSFAYPSGWRAVDDVSFTALPGQVTGYLGPNGSGKSTTVKMITGLLEPSEGHVLWQGTDVRTDLTGFQAQLGYVPEEPYLYPHLTGAEYLELTGELRLIPRQRLWLKIEAFLREFGLWEDRYTAIASYSKGMRQKLLIIASLIHNPDLLFLDEPINGLDANSVMIFKEILTQLAANGKTIFYSSHIMDVVEKISSRIILLYDGNIAADGTFAQLQAGNTEGTLERIFNQLTGFHEHQEIGEKFVSIVRGVQS